MTKREVAFFRQKRGNPAADIVKTLRELGYSDEQIKTQLVTVQSERNAQKAAQVATEAQEYERGQTDGAKDMALIMQPINTGGYTYDEFIRVQETYIGGLAPSPSPYHRGYCEGADTWAFEHGSRSHGELEIHDAVKDNDNWSDFDRPATEPM